MFAMVWDEITPSVIIDLGANVGYATIYFKNQNPKAKIISVEPDIKNFNQLLLNTKKLNSSFAKLLTFSRAWFFKEVHLGASL